MRCIIVPKPNIFTLPASDTCILFLYLGLKEHIYSVGLIIFMPLFFDSYNVYRDRMTSLMAILTFYVGGMAQTRARKTYLLR